MCYNVCNNHNYYHNWHFHTFQYVNSPVCCPSRSTLLVGKYMHNTGVNNNSLSGNCSSESWQKHHEPFSTASLLKTNKNYTTFYAGKYLNQVKNCVYLDYVICLYILIRVSSINTSSFSMVQSSVVVPNMFPKDTIGG